MPAPATCTARRRWWRTCTGGKLPRTWKELLKLPGIGEYSAGAILSLAYGAAEPILDGNVKRVFSRLGDIDSPIEERATLKILWGMAQALAEAAAEGQAGVVNEGLMELGVLVCTPGNPRCLVCPLQICAPPPRRARRRSAR